ncbi:MAG: HEAT repeat domain-containing protein [Actinobacteria bacterium]|nr:HEAT repeat domain-containing protein [Actinomycetota bacterium]
MSMPKFGLGKRDIKKLERERDVDAIIEFLYDEDDKTVFEAIEALTRMADPRGIEAMMALVADVATSDLIRAKAWLALDVGIERESKKRTDWK